MYVYVDETLQLGLDRVAALNPHAAVAFGWVMTPRGEETGLSIHAEGGEDCAIEHSSFHPRPDVVPRQPDLAVVNGFCLLVSTPPGTGDLTLLVRAGDRLLRAAMRGPEVRTDLARVTAECDCRTSFALLAACAEDPALAALLSFQATPFGRLRRMDLPHGDAARPRHGVRPSGGGRGARHRGGRGPRYAALREPGRA